MANNINITISQQKNNGDVIRKFTTNTNKTGKDNQTKGFLTGRKHLLNKYWNKFEAAHDIIISFPDQKQIDQEYLEEDIYSEVELIYTTSLGLINDALLALETANLVPGIAQHDNNQINPTNNGQIKLPAIILPTFTGDFTQWNSFHDLFDSLVVKNIALSNVNKLHHLKSSLSGEAELVLRPFAIEGHNFETAWALLKRRFANKRMLVNAQFSRLMSQSKINNCSPESIRHILDTSIEAITALKSQLTAGERFDALLIFIISQKLEIKSIEAWEQSINTNENVQTFEAFSTFLENYCRTQELIQSTVNKPIISSRNQEFNRVTKSFHSVNSSVQCILCNKDNHSIYRCYRFKRLTVQERLHMVQSKNLCTRCLSSDHLFENCPHTYQCYKCKASHNILLHQSETATTSNSFVATTPQQNDTNVSLPPAVTTSSNNVASQITTNDSIVYTHHGINQSQTLLATAQVNIQSTCGKTLRFRALIDPGSQATLITRTAANLLNLKIKKCNTTVRGLGATIAGESNHMVNCKVSSIYNEMKSIFIEAVVMSKLTDMLPSNFITVSPSWTHLQHLQLADPTYYKPEKIDIILGADVYGDLIIPEIRKGLTGEPVAQNTTLGWIIIGKFVSTSTQQNSSREVIACFSEITVCDQLRKFWELEEVIDVKKPTKEDILSETHFQRTHSRKPDGHYSVDLPFKTKDNMPPNFGNTRKMAFMRLYQVERRLNANLELKAQYTEFMNEYIRLGHMNPIQDALPTSAFYVPHHAIIKPSSTSTKLRVVFDASAKDSNGSSLNETLRIGPTIQQDLLSILLRWRKYKYAITSDIEKMYRQIEVNPQHRPFQRILWRGEDGRVSEYELSTVTYGTACAPYLAIRTVHQLAMDEKANFPETYQRAIADMYVDDFISGGDTFDETITLQRDMASLFKRGGFNLRKWASNSQNILDHIPTNSRDTSTCLDVCHEEVNKTLGVFWHTTVDQFRFNVVLPDEPPNLTKRALLSEVAKLFDPFGFLAPVVINAKILFQSLWLKGVEWDDALPDDIAQEWLTLRANLKHIMTIQIPRWIGTSKASMHIEFHGFCDASEKAYAAVVYCRTVDNGNYVVHLLTSKTRVAPIKRISLPNLELCGATLLAKLMKKVRDTMDIDAEIFAWTDSTIVLDWIRSNTHKATFVANRVSTILDYLKPSQWRHVRSKDNPADVASRGICPSQLKNHVLWWTGPEWLQHETNFCPLFIDPVTTIIEVHSSTINKITTDLATIIMKFSSLDKLTKVIAYCLLFARKCRPRTTDPHKETHLSGNDFREALTKLLVNVQHNNYSDEIKLINKSASLKSSKIAALSPFICNNGLIRVGGRLQNAKISYGQKHPILLPRNEHLTKLIITKVHQETLHGGLKLTLATLRQTYWVTNARTAVREIIHKCIKCRRYASNCNQQLMSALPKARVLQSKVFSHTGVDYAGPFDLRLSKHRGRGTYKGFVAIFVCLSTKAIHLELASDLTGKTFIAAYKRFVARRGACTDLYSDNGTNFTGANRYLQTKFDEVMIQISSTTAEALAIKGINWHFIPASSPHFGGLWEAGVKSFKHHLRRIIENTTLTYEEFSTLLAQIEATLNSRPLCPLSSDPCDMDALTPGHFLVGSPLNAVPEPSVLNIQENRLDRWQLLEKMNQDFWKTWTREYLSELQQRPKKWRNQQQNLKEGDIVLIKDMQLPPMKWPLARILKTHPGTDGLVRAVTIKHKNGETKRAINKLCYLPIGRPE